MTKISNEAIYQAAVAIYCASFMDERTEWHNRRVPMLDFNEATDEAKRLAALIEEGE